MANTVLTDKYGPDFPLGHVKVTTPGTPVSIMVNVDSSNNNAPQTPTGTDVDEYTRTFQQIMFQGIKPGASHGMQNNSGNVYIVRTNAAGAGSGNRDDPGVMVKVLAPGETFFLASSAWVNDVFGPYRYSLDADSANDGALVTGLSF